MKSNRYSRSTFPLSRKSRAGARISGKQAARALRLAGCCSAALWLLTSSICFAQQNSAQNQTQNQNQSNSQDESEADQNAQPQEYQGPSILSRDKSLIGERGGKLLDFRFYGSLTGIYDTGLVPVESNGNLAQEGGSAGLEAGYGVIGSRTWKRDRLSVEYTGSYVNYPQLPLYNGLNQFLNLRYSHRITRHITLDTKVTAGTSNIANGFFSYLPLSNSDQFAVPSNELFDVRTNFVQTGVNLVYQQTARLSYIIGGQGYIVRRSSLALTGLDGYRAHAGVAYRLSRRQTISADYSYTHYDFQRAFGYTNLQSGAVAYSIDLNRRWEILTQAGGIFLVNRGLEVVTLSPEIAAILGTSTAVVSFLARNAIPYLDGQIIRRFPHATLNVSASDGVSPGDGIYLTSRATTASVNYSYVGIHRLTLGANAAYSELSSVGQNIGKYQNYQGGIGATYKVAPYAHFEFRYDYRHYTANNAFYHLNSQRVSLGFAFSPGEKPLPIW